MFYPQKIAKIRRDNKISVIGKNIPALIESFDQLKNDYNVPANIIENLKSFNFSAPTPVQMQAMTVMLKVNLEMIIRIFLNLRILLYLGSTFDGLRPNRFW